MDQSEMKMFRHAGDRGDIVAAMPAVRALGGGVILIEAAAYTRERLTKDKWLGLDLLLREQSYIADVQPWLGQGVDFNLNDFRAKLHRWTRTRNNMDKNLADWQLEQYGIPITAKDEAWLRVESPIKAARVIFNRSGAGRPAHAVYQNHLFPWGAAVDKYRNDAAFVGTEAEHRVFCRIFGTVPHYQTENLHLAARVISGADLFIGNQSCCFWIAEGMKKRLVLEVWPGGANCIIHRDGALHGWNENVEFPDL